MSTALFERLRWSALALPLFAVPAVAQDDVESALIAHLERGAAARDLGGYTAIVALGGEPLIAVAEGEHVDRDDLDLESTFRTPSLLRPLVSIAVMRLVQDGKVELDAAIGEYLESTVEKAPDWWKGTDEQAPVTVEQLLAGTSGLIGWDGVLTHDQREVATREELMRVALLQGIAADPGRCFEPNETEVLMLGALVEAITEAPVEEAVDAVLSAAGVEGAGFATKGDAPAAVDASASIELDGDAIAAPSEIHPFGEDRLSFSAPQLAQLVRSMADREVLQEDALGEFLSGRRTATGHETGYGLGVDLVRLEKLEGIVVGGQAFGQAVHVARYPEADLTVVLLAATPRTIEDARLALLEASLARIALGIPPPGVLDLELEAEEAAMYVGAYMLGCDRLEVRRTEDGHLVLDRVDRAPVTLLYQGERRFVARSDPGASFEFIMGRDEPKASTLVLFEHGLRSEAVRVE